MQKCTSAGPVVCLSQTSTPLGASEREGGLVKEETIRVDYASGGTGIGIGVSKSDPNVARHLEYLGSCMALQSVCPEVIDCSR
jgi:hypothetical protein